MGLLDRNPIIYPLVHTATGRECLASTTFFVVVVCFVLFSRCKHGQQKAESGHFSIIHGLNRFLSLKIMRTNMGMRVIFSFNTELVISSSRFRVNKKLTNRLRTSIIN